MALTHSSTRRAYLRMLKCRELSTRLGNACSSKLPPRSSSQSSRLWRAVLISSNWTGLLVFRWTTIARCLISGPFVRSPVLIETRSQPLILLSIARSKRAGLELCALALARTGSSRPVSVSGVSSRQQCARHSRVCVPFQLDHIVNSPSYFSFGRCRRSDFTIVYSTG